MSYLHDARRMLRNVKRYAKKDPANAVWPLRIREWEALVAKLERGQ